MPPKKTPASVAADARAKYETITALTDAFCKRHLNEEYAEMCRRLTAALAQKRPTPLARGSKEVWACGIVRTIGWANVLDNPTNAPYMKLIDIDPEFGVAESTGQAKSLAIRRMFGIGRLDPQWTLPSRLGKNPRVWAFEINGGIVDLRFASREQQEAAFKKGLIPYIPADQGAESRTTPRDRNPQLDEPTTEPSDKPIASVEMNLLGSLLGFHLKIVKLLRESSLEKADLDRVSQRITQAMDSITTDIKNSGNLDLSGRLNTAYAEIEQLVADVSGTPPPEQKDEPSK